MKKKLAILVSVLCFYIFPIQAQAGFLYPACLFVCEGLCELFFTGAGFVVAGPFGAMVAASTSLETCLAGCAAACLASCFAPSTTLITLENGVEVEKKIDDIQEGDLVKTIVNGKISWTRVLRNTKTEGDFEFMQIDARNITNGNQHQIRVTPTHGMVLVGSDGRMILDAAEHMAIDDRIVISGGDVLSVTKIDKINMQDKYTLETVDGAVLASDILVSTICNEEIMGGEHLFEPKMQDWKERHKNLLDNERSFSNVTEF